VVKSKWTKLENKLNAQLDSGRIDSKQWYKGRRIDAGSLGSSLQAWFVSEAGIDKISPIVNSPGGNRPIELLIPEEFQVTKENGNRYIKLILINNSDSIIQISRSDATVLGLSCYVKLRNEWILLRGTPIVRCGNSFFTQPLASKSFITVELENIDHGDGDIEVPFKVYYKMINYSLESKEIKIRMLSNQVQRVLEENDLLKPNCEKVKT
jgi:hypothetical protein